MQRECLGDSTLGGKVRTSREFMSRAVYRIAWLASLSHKRFYNRNRGAGSWKLVISLLHCQVELSWADIQYQMTQEKPIECFLQIHFDGWIEILSVPVANQGDAVFRKVFGSNSSCNLYSTLLTLWTTSAVSVTIEKGTMAKAMGFSLHRFTERQFNLPSWGHKRFASFHLAEFLGG